MLFPYVTKWGRSQLYYYWWPISDVGGRINTLATCFVMFVVFRNSDYYIKKSVLNRSPTSWIGHKHLKLVTNTFCLHLVQKNRNFTRVAWYIMKGVKGVSPELDRIRPSFSNVAEFRLHNRFRDLSQTALHLILSYKCCEMIINFDLKWLFKIILQISVKNTN